jgi:hypothetical protein
VHTAPDAGERQFLMEMRGCSDGHGIDAGRKQCVDIGKPSTTEHAGDEIALLAVGIYDAYELHARKVGENAGMVAAHDANAHHAHS